MKYVIPLVLLLSACATPYQSKGLMGGFDELQLAENVFQVRFEGNGYTNRSKAADYTLLRSAELTRDSGYSYFVITDQQSWSQIATWQEPTSVSTTGNAYIYDDTVSYNSTSQVSGGGIYNIRKPRMENVIVCFEEKPKSLGNYYDAELLIKQLTKKYNITLSQTQAPE